MGEQEGPVVGSVTEEAARLLEALGGWASTAQDAYAARAAADAAGGAADAPEAHTHSRCESCGAENGAGQAVVCRLCPLCQGIGLLRSVRPETVDRLADLAGAVATALRDLAAHHGESHASRPQPPSGGSRVQDIRIEDDDQPHPDEPHLDEPHSDEPHPDEPHPDEPHPDQRGSATS